MLYASLAAGAFATFVSFSSATMIKNGIVSIALLVAGGLGLCVIYFAYRFGFQVMPWVMKTLGVSEKMGNGYKVHPSQEVVIRTQGGFYYATMFLAARFYESATQSETDTELTPVHMDLWERALSNINYPFKFSLIAYLEDLAKYREDIETKRYAATIALGKEHEKDRPDALTVDKREREIQKFNRMLGRLSEGERPMGVVMYAATTGLGVNEESAIAAAKKQAGEIRATVANALNIEIRVAKGEDLKRCFRWEYVVPSDRKEFLSAL